MNTARRRVAAALVVGASLVAGTPVVAHADASPKPAQPAPALYGTKDPAFDGVYRQSMAFLAQQAAGVEPAEEAVGWLLAQQCDNGAFPSYRADTSAPCAADLPLDSNATALALQALRGVDSHEDRTAKAMESAKGWLRGSQNKDGGWGYNPGFPSDANSTALAVGALAATGEQPGEVKSADGKTPYDALLTFAIPCSAKDGPGAFVSQPGEKGELKPNEYATAGAVLGGLGKHLLSKGVKPYQEPSCEDADKPAVERAARNGAAHLVSALGTRGHLLLPPMAGSEAPADQPDIGGTADAVVALSAAGHGDKAAGAVAFLEKQGPAWAEDGGPAAYAKLVLAARASGADPRDFGGTDLVQALNATGPKPASTPEQRAAAKAESGKKAQEDENAGVGFWLTIGSFLLAGIGIGFLLSGRGRGKKK
ncbi:terpene cyclase/mutase family protein [Streptomyces sp. MUM 203J]|uniref:prenyltransferase/squalene oxidase repeat-containing protein n=1 Tax=Streptomyces sp. MUM 203J TaxID=2791990 RepID=UPI001F04A3BD|nr:prenyltransferase/squalene oxidase repeat-containing protein [Streptomyces sp. MUM 203J]MCH0539031.1 terpene cyclase/mutase family protein [Streptomyces sp. MUM 203J]